MIDSVAALQIVFLLLPGFVCVSVQQALSAGARMGTTSGTCQ